jgi:hypothetical protein
LGEAVVAGADPIGLVTVVGAELDSGDGDCAEVMQAINDIAVKAISAEVMRVFMPLIVAARPTRSNEKLKYDGRTLELLETADQGGELDATLKSRLSLLR